MFKWIFHRIMKSDEYGFCLLNDPYFKRTLYPQKEEMGGSFKRHLLSLIQPAYRDVYFRINAGNGRRMFWTKHFEVGNIDSIKLVIWDGSSWL